MGDLQPQRETWSAFSGWIGVARADITPPVGIYTREWAAADHSVARSIHRPLFLTVLTLQNSRNASPLVFLDADLGFWRSRKVCEQLLTQLRNRFKVDSERLLFGMSHTHSSVSLVDPDSSLLGGKLLRPYYDRIGQAAEEAIQEALRNAQQASLDWHYGHCSLAKNRDLPDPKPDSSRFLCGFNPNRAADDTLLVGRATSRTGKPLATLVNYACHPTTLAWDNTAISPDFVGAMRQTVEGATGAPAMFMQGASGELAPKYQYVGDPHVADRHGRNLGYACLATLEDMDPPGQKLVFDRVVESGAPLAVWQYEYAPCCTALAAREFRVALPIKNWPSAEELERQRLATTDRARQERLRRQLDTRLALGDGDTCSLSLWVWRIGDAILVGVPEEAYSNLQQTLRQRFCDLPVVCVNLVNDRVGGYLPPRELYGCDIYQVWRSPFAEGSLEIVIEALAATIEELMAEDSRSGESVPDL